MEVSENEAKKVDSKVVSDTNQLKLVAPDGKRRLTDVLDSEGVEELAKSIRNQQAMSEQNFYLGYALARKVLDLQRNAREKDIVEQINDKDKHCIMQLYELTTTNL